MVSQLRLRKPQFSLERVECDASGETLNHLSVCLSESGG